MMSSSGKRSIDEVGNAADGAKPHEDKIEDKIEEGIFIVSDWAFMRNAIAKALVRVVIHKSAWLTSVDKWQDKLYTALTNTIWIHDPTDRYTTFSMRKASGIVAFLDSACGGKPCQDYMDGPYCSAPTGDAVDAENEMHALLRALDFYTIPYPDGEFQIKRFHELHPNGTGAEPLYTPGPPTDYSPEQFWIDAAHLWAHASI